MSEGQEHRPSHADSVSQSVSSFGCPGAACTTGSAASRDSGTGCILSRSLRQTTGRPLRRHCGRFVGRGGVSAHQGPNAGQRCAGAASSCHAAAAGVLTSSRGRAASGSTRRQRRLRCRPHRAHARGGPVLPSPRSPRRLRCRGLDQRAVCGHRETRALQGGETARAARPETIPTLRSTGAVCLLAGVGDVGSARPPLSSALRERGPATGWRSSPTAWTRVLPAIGGPRPASGGVTGKMSYHANTAAAVRLVHRIMPRSGRRPGHAGRCWRARIPSRGPGPGAGPPGQRHGLCRRPACRVCAGRGGGVPARVRGRDSEQGSRGAGVRRRHGHDIRCGAGAAGTAGRHYVTCADDPEFADAIVGLLGDGALRQRLGVAGRDYVVTNHRWERLSALLVAEYEASQRAGTGRTRLARRLPGECSSVASNCGTSVAMKTGIAGQPRLPRTPFSSGHFALIRARACKPRLAWDVH